MLNIKQIYDIQFNWDDTNHELDIVEENGNFSLLRDAISSIQIKKYEADTTYTLFTKNLT